MKHRREARIDPFIPNEPNPNHFPKNHEPGSLKVGDSVWYRDQRFYLECVPESWEESCSVRISSERILPDREPPRDRVSLCVHADMVTVAPVTRNPYGRQPSKKTVDRREKMKQEGVRDNGDAVAMILRDAHSLGDVYKVTAKHLGVTEKELKARYGHLNPGQQRMNCGNRLRGAHKKGLLKLN